MSGQKKQYCKVKGCQENHQYHFCKYCQNENSDHFSSNCKEYNMQGSLKNSSNIHSFNKGPTKINNRFRCRVPDCNENHDRHFCRNCGDSDSEHFTTQCPRQNHENNMKNNFQAHCRIKGCQENHLHHFCEICQSENSDHFSSDCPKRKFLGNSYDIKNLSGIHHNSPKNIQNGCRVKGCQENHSYHFCKVCQSEDSDHFSSECPKKNILSNSYEIKNLSGIRYSPSKGCKVKLCKENHQRHICKFCGDQDSHHFSSECPKKKIGFNNNYQNSKDPAPSYDKKNGYGYPPNLFVSKKKKISLPHKNEKIWSQMEKILKDIKNKKIKGNKDLESVISELYFIGSKKNKTIIKDLNNLTFFIHKYDKSFNFMGTLFPFMASLALRLPKLFSEKKLPLLLKNNNESRTLSKRQVACLMACLFFGLIPNRPRQINYPNVINMRYLLEIPNDVNIEKLACISNYFNNIMEWDNKNEKLDSTVTYRRVAARPSETPTLEDWLNTDNLFNEFEIIHEDSKTELKGVIDVDFANKIVGGGTLTNGSVQEEIKFMMNPEAIISMMFFESLEDNEIAYIEGTDQINEYQGYKKTFNFNGNFQKEKDNEEIGEKKNAILVMDALSFQNADPEEQYTKENILRELNKSYLGFNSHKNKVILTGKWGCGVFQGDSQLKFVLQWISASKCQKKMLFSTFGEFDFNTDFLRAIFENKEIKQLLECILNYKRKEGKLFDFIHRIFTQKESVKEETKEEK